MKNGEVVNLKVSLFILGFLCTNNWTCLFLLKNVFEPGQEFCLL